MAETGYKIVHELCDILERENTDLRQGTFTALDSICIAKMDAVSALDTWLQQVKSPLERDILAKIKRIDMLSSRNKKLLLATRNSITSAKANLYALKNASSDIGAYNRLGKTVRLNNNTLNKVKYL